MKTNKVLVYLILLGVSCLAIIYAYDLPIISTQEGAYYEIKPINTLLSQGTFEISAIEKLREDEAYSKMAISYVYREEITIEGMGKKKKATVIQTNSDYKVAYGLIMQAGNFFNESGGSSESVVLNETLAFELFGSDNIIGEEVKVNGKNFKVLGVAKEIQKNEGASLYIQDLEDEVEKSVYVEEIRIYSYTEQNLLNHEKMQRILQSLNKEKEAYEIIEVKPRYFI